MKWLNLHTHSEYSPLDGMPRVADMVERVVSMGQPGLGLTDHGYMSGSLTLYREAKRAGILPYPGSEFYLVDSVGDKTAKRYHLTLLARTREGYKDLLRLSSLSHSRDQYHHRPRIDWANLESLEHHDGILCLTGCYGGPVVQALVHHDESVARWNVERLIKMFPYTYIELQDHDADRIGEEADGVPEWSDHSVVEALWSIATDMGVPVMATQDSHYLRLSDRPLHDLMKEIVVHGFENRAFRGDGFHLATEQWVRSHYTEEQWDAILESSGEIVDLHALSLPAMDTYRYHVPSVLLVEDGEDEEEAANRELRRLTEEAFESIDPKKRKKRVYVERLNHELEVIEGLGMASYFLLVHDYVAWSIRQGYMVNARGSASASIVCWLLRITQLDPIEWDLLFERFLSPDRTKPPDIDLDIEDVHRKDLVEYVLKRFDVTQIGTFSTLGSNEAGTGSVMVQFLARKRKDLAPDVFKERYGGVRTLSDLPEGMMLEALGRMRVRKAAGSHAAGFVLSSPEHPLNEYVPTMLIPSSKLQVTQMTMDDVEAAGFIKIDLLGLRSLTTIKRTLERIGRDPLEGLDWIPMNDTKTLQDLRKGKTDTGVFQFEGWAAAKGCREVGVRSTMDCIAVMALYRPATMQSGYTAEYLRRRKLQRAGIVSWENPHESFEVALSETYGVAVYQEQVLVILRELGFPVVDRNVMLSALKLSNDKAAKAQEIFQTQYKRFVTHCVDEVGMAVMQADTCWSYIAGFAGYGFNRSHAAAYGLLGYRAAYLKTHHPLEFMVSVLETTAGTDKERTYEREARSMKIRIRQPDVNTAGANWRIHGDSLVRGLVSIKGVGLKAAEEIEAHQPYESMEDLIERTASRVITGGKLWRTQTKLTGVLETLRQAGALRSLGVPYT